MEERFDVSGPFYLTNVDWSNLYHRKSVLASLVEGVYNLSRLGPQPPDYPLWNYFYFQPIEYLIDIDKSIFGAVYEFHPPMYATCYPPMYATCYPPRYVIAFRGNLWEPETILHELRQDLRAFLGRLCNSPTFDEAMEAVNRTVCLAGGPQNVWLTGHSLGSAYALLAGKAMAAYGYPIETYLFNPPFLSGSYERLHWEEVKMRIRFLGFRAGLPLAFSDPTPYEEFVRLSDWIPYLFVNPNDPICSRYIDYFRHRETIAKGDWDPLHLIPSAFMTTNLTYFPNLASTWGFRQRLENFRRDHGIQQWWDPCFYGPSTFHLL